LKDEIMPTDHETGIYFGHAGSRATPAYLKSIGDRPSGAENTVGNIGRIAEAVAEVKAALANIDPAKNRDLVAKAKALLARVDAAEAVSEAVRKANAAFNAKADAMLAKIEDLRKQVDELEQRFAPPPVIRPANGRWDG
jgi:hypothetical protein